MPVIAGTNGFEFDLEIDHGGSTYTIDNGDFHIADKQLVHDMGDQQIPTLQFSIDLSTLTKTFSIMDPVRLKVRAVGEPNYLIRFTGFITKKKPRSKDMKIAFLALGKELLLKAKFIPFKQYGNEYVEDQELTAVFTALNTYEFGVYFQLDSTGTIQVPLEKATANKGLGGMGCFNGAARTLDIYNSVAQGSNKVAIPFYHAGGELYGMCFHLTKAIACSEDLVISIAQVVDDATDMSPSSDILLSGVLSQDLLSASTWYKLHFLQQKKNLSPGMYCAILEQANPTADSIPPSPYYQVNGGTLQGVGKPVYGFNNNGGGYVLDQSQFPLYFPDSEGNHVHLWYDEDYTIDANNKLWIKKDGFYWKSRGEGAIHEGRYVPLARFSYWKGDMDYSSTLEDLLQDYYKGIATVLDIIVSEPDIKFQCVTLQNCWLWDALKKFREYQKITWRIHEDLAGTTTIEVRDKMDPSIWAAESSDWQDIRTFKHGYDGATNDAYVCIEEDDLEENLENLANEAIAYDDYGKLFPQSNSSGTIPLSLGFQSASPIGGGINHGNLGGLSDMIIGQMRSVSKSGDISLSDVDMSVSNSLFISPNELIQIIDSDTGFNAVYAIDTLSIDYGNGGKVRIKIFDTVVDSFVPSLMGGSGLTSQSKSILPKVGGSGKTIEGLTYAGAAFSTTSKISTRGGTGRANEVLNLNSGDCDNITFDVSITYDIAIGIGSPTSTGLGNEIASVSADIQLNSDGSVIVYAEFNDGAITGTLQDSFPITITECALKTGGSAIFKKSVGTDKDGGGFDVNQARPVIHKGHGKISIFMKLLAP
jgi:hypothetical protein